MLNNYTTPPTVPCTCAHCNVQLPSKYLKFIPLNTIVNQLLHLDNKKLAIPLPDGPSLAADIVCYILKADLALDSVTNLTTDDERDLPTVCHM